MVLPHPFASPAEPSSGFPLPPSAEAKPPGVPGDRLSFPEIHERYAADVARWVRLSGVAERDWPDVVQETWMRVERALAGFEAQLPFEPWLCTIARHAACDHLRRPHVRHEMLAGVQPKPKADVELLAQRRHDGEAVLEQAGAELPDEEWEVYVWVEIEGQTCPEVAAALGVPEGTVRSRLQRARRRVAGIVARMDARGRRRRRMVVWPAAAAAWPVRWSSLRRWVRGHFTLGAVTGGLVVYWLLQPARVPAPAVSTPVAVASADRPAAPATVTAELPAPPTGKVEVVPPAVTATERPDPPTGKVDVAPPATTAAELPELPTGNVEVVSPAGVPPNTAFPAIATSSGALARGKAQPAGSRAAGSGAPASPSTSPGDERAAERSALLALAAAQALLRNGRCADADRTLAPHADRLARGMYAPEYQELRRRVEACPR